MRAYKDEAGIDFSHIRESCETDSPHCDFDTHPLAFAEHRRRNWPEATLGPHFTELADIYSSVRATGLPNAASARRTLPTKLNLAEWETHLKGYDDTLLDYIKFGFPLGYMGPQSHSAQTPNHPSATQYVSQVDSFIKNELSLGGLIGPLPGLPFDTWTHVSPIMTRPKSDPEKRRVITDLTFPRDRSINAFIRKNTVMGMANSHSLPTVDSLVDRVLDIGPGAHMFTIDVSRAYKNFKSCPLDWPLLAIRWREDHYLDVTMPFGARASSGHMQRVADSIVAALARSGIVAHMYLDDLVVVAPSYDMAMSQYDFAKELLARLGLPEAMDKSQPPATAIKWLGVNVDSIAGTLSIPHEKIEQLVTLSKCAIRRRSITRKQLQSILGKMLHVAKCIHPARLFVARLLDELRGPKRTFINLNSSMRADIKWFIEFASQWNGVALFPNKQLVREIVVDACIQGIGAATHSSAYAVRLRQEATLAPNITEIEAINVAVALQTFLGPSDTGKTIKVLCDNLPAVSVLQTGRGKNHVVLEAARQAWMVQALFQVSIIYEHIPGRLNTLADTLSRAPLSHNHMLKAQNDVASLGLKWVAPCLHALTALRLSSSRSVAPDAVDSGGREAGLGQGPRDQRQQAVGGKDVPLLLPQTSVDPSITHPPTSVYLYRDAEQPEPGPTHSPKPHRTYTDIPTAGGRTTCGKPPQGQEGARRHIKEEGLYKERQTPSRPSNNNRGHKGSSTDEGANSSPRSDSHDFLWRFPSRGGCPPDGQGLRPPTPPYQSGYSSTPRSPGGAREGGQEHAAIQSEAGYHYIPRQPGGYVPCESYKTAYRRVSNAPAHTAHVRVQGITEANHSGLSQVAVERSPKSNRGPI